MSTKDIARNSNEDFQLHSTSNCHLLGANMRILDQETAVRLEESQGKFLKRALGLSKYTASRLVSVLARETFLLDDLRLKLLLPCSGSMGTRGEER